MLTPATIDTLLARYSGDHLDPTNELIHVICVPAVALSLLGLAWSIHALLAVTLGAVALRYYSRLSRRFAIGMLAMALIMLGLLLATPPAAILPLSLALFALAWIGQFIGHMIEGRRPSWRDEVRALPVGPLFVLRFLFRHLRPDE